MPTVSFQAPTDYSAEAEEIARRRKYAEMLQAQSMEPIATPQTPAGGFTPNVSWTQGLAKMLQAYSGRKGQEAATEEQKALAARMREQGMGEAQDFMRALQGTPARSIAPDPQEAAQSADFGTPEVGTANVPATPPNRAQALSIALNAINPAVRGAGGSLLKELEPYTLAEGATRFGPNGQPIASNPKSHPLHFGDTGGAIQPFDPMKGTPVGAPIPKTVAPKEDELARAIQAAGLDPNSPEAKALYQQRAVKIATHAPPTRVNVNQSLTTEKKYGEQFASNIAKADSEMRDAAIKAPQLADRANQIKQILANGNVITGAGADIRLAMDKALALAGVKSADGTAANTETLASGLAQNTLDAIKASGLGSGNGFSNADRDFLEKAVGGKITLQKETIDRLANLAHRAADQTAKRWSTRVKEIPASALEGTGIKAEPVQVSPLFGGATDVRSKADQIINGGS